MTSIDSTTVTDSIKALTTFVFTTDNTITAEENITSDILNSEESARLYATAKFLDANYDKQTVDFETYFQDVQVGDIISLQLPDLKIPLDLTKNRLVVKSVSFSLRDNEAISSIKAERYDKRY